MDASFDVYPEGYSCFTLCGEMKCPSSVFLPPNPANDFKVSATSVCFHDTQLADCQSNYRVRCRISAENANKKVGIPDLTMELQLGHRNYDGATSNAA